MPPVSTIHFESEETPWGMKKKEWELLREVSPSLDFMTVFSFGAHRAEVEAFPLYREKVAVLRHGIHRYPRVSQDEARQNLFAYLIQQAKIPLRGKAELELCRPIFLLQPGDKTSVSRGNFGGWHETSGPGWRGS